MPYSFDPSVKFLSVGTCEGNGLCGEDYKSLFIMERGLLIFVLTSWCLWNYLYKIKHNLKLRMKWKRKHFFRSIIIMSVICVDNIPIIDVSQFPWSSSVNYRLTKRFQNSHWCCFIHSRFQTSCFWFMCDSAENFARVWVIVDNFGWRYLKS